MRRPTVSPLASALALLLSSAAVTAVPADNTFEIVGNSGVSAQQVRAPSPSPCAPFRTSSFLRVATARCLAFLAPTEAATGGHGGCRVFRCGGRDAVAAGRSKFVCATRLDRLGALPLWPPLYAPGQRTGAAAARSTAHRFEMRTASEWPTTELTPPQVFLGQSNKVYVIDKTENNPLRVNGHPAWATEYDLSTNTPRAMDIKTNSFCAGGNVLGTSCAPPPAGLPADPGSGNGTWVNIGGNQPIGPGGLNAASASAPYEDTDGGKAVRTLDVCADASCDWTDNAANYMTTRRWYPTLETVEDGSIIIVR